MVNTNRYFDLFVKGVLLHGHDVAIYCSNGTHLISLFSNKTQTVSLTLSIFIFLNKPNCKHHHDMFQNIDIGCNLVLEVTILL